MTNTTIGILAHVDAGKTTLSESILFRTGTIRRRGRVDHADAFLDTDEMEKKRGITIYSKLARFTYQGRLFTILDTPGHADFSPEMERTLRVLDTAILVISASDIVAQKGADPQVLTLWRLLSHYRVPVIIFINKMDQQRSDEGILPEGETAAISGRPLPLHAEKGENSGRMDRSPADPSPSAREELVPVICRPDAADLSPSAREELVPVMRRSDAADLSLRAREEALRRQLFSMLEKDLGAGLVSFDERQLCGDNEEAVAVCDDSLMERILDGGTVTDADVAGLIAQRKLFPVYFGAALRDEGTQDLLDGLVRYTQAPQEHVSSQKSGDLSGQPFGAMVYKITREDGVRLTWMKITTGMLSIRDSVKEEAVPGPGTGMPDPDTDTGGFGEDEDPLPGSGIRKIQEKVTEIRLYSGDRFTSVTSACAGEIAAVAGLSHTRAGDGLGVMETCREELLTPIMTSRVTAEDLYGRKTDAFTLMKALRGLAEQEPMLQPEQNEDTGDITIRIMGEVQTEILREQLRNRYGLRAQFSPGTIVYRETIRRPVEGVGHFEPLRHYAEVHLVLEPGEPGSGIAIEDDCPPDTLERNWRNLILTHLEEKEHRGVLTGSALTDVRIRVIGGKASRKHTSGGDFRRATYSAVRQGLMSAENILLEPVLSFRMELPSGQIGRAMNDITRMSGSVHPVGIDGETAVLEGSVPASEFGDYAQTLAGYTGGRGQMGVSLKGYEPCHNAREVIDRFQYDPDADRRNVSSSVFCSHGAGTTVPWDRVREFMHVETGWMPPQEEGPFRTDDYYTFTGESTEPFELDLGEDAYTDLTETERQGNGAAIVQRDHSARRRQTDDYKKRQQSYYAGEEELRRIFERTYGPIRQNVRHPENEKYYGGMDPEEREAESCGRTGTRQAADAAADKSTEAGVPAKSKERGASGAMPGGDPDKRKRHSAGSRRPEEGQEYLLVDGYNIIYAWQDLKELASVDIAAARGRLLDILSDYAGYSGLIVIVVFDAYRVPGGKGEILRYHNIDVVFTKEAETADLYIEQTAHKLARNHRVTVATGDCVEQVIIFGAGALRLSPRGLLEAILYARRELRERYL